MNQNYDDIAYIESIVEILEADQNELLKLKKKVKTTRILLICLFLIQLGTIGALIYYVFIN